jgi:ATP-dependent DNA ligase
VGSGLDVPTRRKLAERLAPLQRDQAVIPISPDASSRWSRLTGPVVWVEPQVFCQVKYLERTESGELRAPVFMGVVEG